MSGTQDRIKKDIFKKIEEFFNEESERSQERLSVAYPCFDHREVNQALDSLLDLWISQGPKVKKFESDYADYIGVKHGIACNSGSSANLLAVSALIATGRVNVGDEVIVPSATFTTVVSPLLQCGLIPVFVDIEMETYNIDPKAIEEAITDKTGLIMVVDSLGCPAKMDEILEISNRYNVPILEDCCEAHGSAILNKKIGSFGLVSTFSFFVAHNMTTGEGGMVMTNDDELNSTLRSLREFGRLVDKDENETRFYYTDEELTEYDERYVFTQVGFNLRMTDIAASLGIEQLKKLDSFNEKRNVIAKKYTEALSKYSSLIKTPSVPEGFYHTFYGYPILVNPNASFTRRELVNFLEDNGIETRAFMGGDLSRQPAYRDTKCEVRKEMKNTKTIAESGFFIGCHPFVSDSQIKNFVNCFSRFLEDRASWV